MENLFIKSDYMKSLSSFMIQFIVVTLHVVFIYIVIKCILLLLELDSMTFGQTMFGCGI